MHAMQVRRMHRHHHHHYSHYHCSAFTTNHRAVFRVDHPALPRVRRRPRGQDVDADRGQGAGAVARVPMMHAVLAPDDESYTVPEAVHVGVTISTPSGLAVPCVRDAQDKSVEEIAADISRLRRRALDLLLSREDVEGATVTLSNIGSIGLVSGIGVVRVGQTALVTVGKAVDGEVRVTASADHRLVDGAVLGAFLAAFREELGGMGDGRDGDVTPRAGS